MNYHLFIDECGDAFLPVIDPNFPIFTLCGVVMSDEQLKQMESEVEKLKHEFWGEKKVILHSRDIRKHQKGFEILFDDEVKKRFYLRLNELMTTATFDIVGCATLKEPYVRQFGKLTDIYSTSLSYIVERTVFLLDERKDAEALYITIEKRGKKEDNKLLAFYNQLLAHGTYWTTPERISRYFRSYKMKPKSDDVTGLQIADLVAYPITRHAFEPDFTNPAYDVIASKIYQFKTFPQQSATQKE